MDRETIIKLAKECDLVAGNADHGIYLMALQRFAKLVAEHEREAIKDEWWMCVQSDLENGVKSLNDRATEKWKKEYPQIFLFGSWLEERGQQ